MDVSFTVEPCPLLIAFLKFNLHVRTSYGSYGLGFHSASVEGSPIIPVETCTPYLITQSPSIKINLSLPGLLDASSPPSSLASGATVITFLSHQWGIPELVKGAEALLITGSKVVRHHGHGLTLMAKRIWSVFEVVWHWHLRGSLARAIKSFTDRNTEDTRHARAWGGNSGGERVKDVPFPSWNRGGGLSVSPQVPLSQGEADL